MKSRGGEIRGIVFQARLVRAAVAGVLAMAMAAGCGGSGGIARVRALLNDHRAASADSALRVEVAKDARPARLHLWRGNVRFLQLDDACDATLVDRPQLLAMALDAAGEYEQAAQEPALAVVARANELAALRRAYLALAPSRDEIGTSMFDRAQMHALNETVDSPRAALLAKIHPLVGGDSTLVLSMGLSASAVAGERYLRDFLTVVSAWKPGAWRARSGLLRALGGDSLYDVYTASSRAPEGFQGGYWGFEPGSGTVDSVGQVRGVVHRTAMLRFWKSGESRFGFVPGADAHGPRSFWPRMWVSGSGYDTMTVYSDAGVQYPVVAEAGTRVVPVQIGYEHPGGVMEVAFEVQRLDSCGVSVDSVLLRPHVLGRPHLDQWSWVEDRHGEARDAIHKLLSRELKAQLVAGRLVDGMPADLAMVCLGALSTTGPGSSAADRVRFVRWFGEDGALETHWVVGGGKDGCTLRFRYGRFMGGGD